MDMQGQRVLHVTNAQAWDALNDPAILKSCIPGCDKFELVEACLLYTSPSPRDRTRSRMPSSA